MFKAFKIILKAFYRILNPQNELTEIFCAQNKHTQKLYIENKTMAVNLTLSAEVN